MFPIKMIPFLAAAVVAVVGGVVLYFSKAKPSQCPSYGHGSRETRKNNNQCSICLKQMDSSEKVILPCGDTFCGKCITSLISGTQTTCPVCRVEIFPEVREHLKSNQW